MRRKNTYKCDLCGKCYYDNSALRVHLIRHRSKEDLPFKCSQCDHKASTKLDLSRHESSHTMINPDTSYKCNVCPKQYKNKQDLNYHIKAVHNEKTCHKCDTCDFKTFSKVSLRGHKKNHLVENKVKCVCPVCNSTFQTKMNLKNHLLNHIDLKSFKCNDCGKAFTMKNRLLAHISYVHHPQKLECNECQKCFSNIHSLNRHLLIHSGSKPFSCCYCKHSTTTQYNLMKHVKSIHHKLNDTYKDILIKSGKLDVPAVSSVCREEGKHVAEQLLTNLRQRNICDLSLDQLHKKVPNKKRLSNAKVASESRRKFKQQTKKTTAHFLKEEQPKSLELDVDINDGAEYLLPGIDEGAARANHSIVILPSNSIRVDWSNTHFISNNLANKVKKKNRTRCHLSTVECNTKVRIDKSLANPVVSSKPNYRSLVESTKLKESDVNNRVSSCNYENITIPDYSRSTSPNLKSNLLNKEMVKNFSLPSTCVSSEVMPLGEENNFPFEFSLPYFETLPPKMEINLPIDVRDNTFVIHSEDTSEALSSIIISESFNEGTQYNQEMNVVSIAEYEDKHDRDLTIILNDDSF